MALCSKRLSRLPAGFLVAAFAITGCGNSRSSGGTSAPVVALTANPTTLAAGGRSTLTWSSTNATSCMASGAWSGSEPTSGTQTVAPAATSAYTLTCTGANGSGHASITLTVAASIANFYIYRNDEGSSDNGLNSYWNYDLSYGNGFVDYKDTTHPETGHTYDLHVHLMGWQPASNNQLPYGRGPFGVDISAYTWMTFDLWTEYPANEYDSRWEYLGDNASGTADQGTPAYVSSILKVPGVGPLQSGAWTTVRIPLAYFGQLGMHAVYKFFLRDNSGNAAGDFYLDNVGLVPGDYSWIYDGGAVNSWNEATQGWNWDPSTPLNGWADATPAGATPNYAFNPSSLTSLRSQGPSGLNGLVSPGHGSIVSTNVIELSITSAGGMWKVIHGGGFTLSPYAYLTFGLLPTHDPHSYEVQLYSTSGAPVGSVVDPASHTNQDWGSTDAPWTVYCIPLSAFGSLPVAIGGLSIKDTSGLSTNTIYITAPGFFD